MSRTKRTLIALLGLVIAGCSSGGGTGGSTTPTQGVALSRDDYALRLAEWLCDDLAACCDGTQQSFDRDACVAVKQKAELHRVASEEAHSGRGFDEGMASTCVARLQETPTDCGAERRVSECFRTFDGLREIGEECAGKIQCRGSVRGETACIEGRCAARLDAGEACQDLPREAGKCDVCRPDARCREDGDGNHFCYGYESRRGMAGDPCSKDFSLPADPTEVSLVATCANEDGLYCSTSGICEAFSPTGAACTLSAQCGTGARCVGGVCAAGLPVGETCTSPFNQCAAGLYCHWTDFVCTDTHPVTQQCVDYDLISGQCAVPASDGEACGRLVDCAQGLLCVRTTPGGGSEGHCATPENNLCTSGLERLTRQSR